MSEFPLLPASTRSAVTWPAEQPTIVRSDLVLRPWHAEDAAAVAEACQDPLIGRFTRIPQPYALEDAVAFIAGSPQAWQDRTAATFAGVSPDDEDTVLVSLGLVRINPVDLAAEIGYWTVPQHRRRGHTATAVRMLSEVALKQWGFVRIELLADVANVASQRVAVAAGFKHEGIARCSLLLAGRIATPWCSAGCAAICPHDRERSCHVRLLRPPAPTRNWRI